MRWCWLGLVIVAALSPWSAHAQDAATAESTTSEATETETTASAPSTPATRPPKVAIVIAGDPDPSTVAAAAALEGVLAAEPRLTLPSDAAMRAALRGEGTSADGLDEVRAERRRLGLGEARDVTVLTVLGELANADLVLVVRASHGAMQATGFDVLRRSFYDGELALEPIDVARAQHFVVRRATRAARPLEEGELAAPPPAPVVDPSVAVDPDAIAPDAEPPPHEPDFFEQYWPYFAAGALLIGAVVFIVLATQNNATPPPVLRFEAGGGS